VRTVNNFNVQKVRTGRNGPLIPLQRAGEHKTNSETGNKPERGENYPQGITRSLTNQEGRGGLCAEVSLFLPKGGGGLCAEVSPLS